MLRSSNEIIRVKNSLAETSNNDPVIEINIRKVYSPENLFINSFLPKFIKHNEINEEIRMSIFIDFVYSELIKELFMKLIVPACIKRKVSANIIPAEEI
jgi:hypothetical protein